MCLVSLEFLLTHKSEQETREHYFSFPVPYAWMDNHALQTLEKKCWKDDPSVDEGGCGFCVHNQIMQPTIGSLTNPRLVLEGKKIVCKAFAPAIIVHIFFIHCAF